MRQATEWIWQHRDVIIAVMAGVIAILRLVPAPAWRWLEEHYPRVANSARLLRAIAPDIVKAARALWTILSGRPWPFVTIEAVATAPRKP